MILNAVECVKINIAERIDTTFGPCYAFRAFHTNRRMARRTEKKLFLQNIFGLKNINTFFVCRISSLGLKKGLSGKMTSRNVW